MLMLAALLAQTAAAQPAPDVEVNVRATVREVRVTRRGEASLRVHASPDAGSRAGAGTPPVEARQRRQGRSVNIHAEARIADPRTNSPTLETSSPN